MKDSIFYTQLTRTLSEFGNHVPGWTCGAGSPADRRQRDRLVTDCRLPAERKGRERSADEQVPHHSVCEQAATEAKRQAVVRGGGKQTISDCTICSRTPKRVQHVQRQAVG